MIPAGYGRPARGHTEERFKQSTNEVEHVDCIHEPSIINIRGGIVLFPEQITKYFGKVKATV